MHLQDILDKRRSIRKFLDKEVDSTTIEALCKAALKAPSSRNSHSTHLLVIDRHDIIEQAATMRDYGSGFIKGAPLFILVMGDKSATDLWEVNCAITATTLQLAATDLGLASCWVHIDGRAQLKENPEGTSAEEYLRSLVDIPTTFGVLCGIAVGYSDFEPAALPPFDAASHIETLR